MNSPPLESLDSSLPRLQPLARQNGDTTPPSGDPRSPEEKVRDAIVADPTILDDLSDGLGDDDDEVEWVWS